MARFSFPFVELEEKAPGFVERKMDDLIVSPRVLEEEPEESQGHELSKSESGSSLGIEVE